MSGDRDLVFVGGDRAGGTHALSRLIGHHPTYECVPIEARFHCDERGVPDLLEGRVSLGRFLAELRGGWWRGPQAGEEAGLAAVAPEPAFEDAVARFEGRYHADPVSACAALFDDLLGPIAERAGKPGLVEMSPHNIREAQSLRRMFAGARFVHLVRDGRSVAAAGASGAREVIDGIERWADELRAEAWGVRGSEDGAEYMLPAERLHVMVQDDFLRGEREAAYQSLLGFLEIEGDVEMRSCFENDLGPGTAHHGEWRQGLGRLAQARVDRRYERTLRTLEQEGNHAAPALIAAFEWME